MKGKLPFPAQESGKRCHALAQEIVRVLGAEWAYDEAGHVDRDSGELYPHADLVHTPTSMRIGVHLNWYEGRLNVHGVYQERDRNGKRIDTPYNFERPRMSVDPMRGAEVIAREISRRLLPAARAAWGVYMARVNEWRADQTKQASLADRLCETGLVCKARNHDDRGDSVRLYLREPAGAEWHGAISATSENVSIELRYLTEEQALRVLRALAEP
jgi:hypothetical protein